MASGAQPQTAEDKGKGRETKARPAYVIGKVPVEYMVVENEGHSLSHRENQVEFLARSARFLEDALKQK